MDREMPLISVIIPVYNINRKYLKQCIDSVAAQTYTNLEIIIIDDGSTDGSAEICDEYAHFDRRFKVFHTRNKGLSAARNHGLDNVDNNAEYVAFIDSDDWMERNMIQALFDAAYNYQADVVCCLISSEYAKGSKQGMEAQHETLLEDEELLKAFLKGKSIRDVAWNKLYKTELFQAVRYPEGRVFEDIATTYKIITAARKVVVIPYNLIHYRIRDNSLSRIDSMKCLTDRWKSYHEKYEKLSPSLTDKICCQALIGDCINAISRMWRCYYGCNKEERVKANPVLNEMQRFVSEQYDEVMHSREYNSHQKIACLFAKTRNPILMVILYMCTRIYVIPRRLRYYTE